MTANDDAPARQPPAQQPPAQEPPAQEPPAQKPPAQQPPAQEPPSTRQRDDGPRENRGRHSAADDLGVAELKAALTEYGDSYRARGAGEAGMIRALGAAYDIALTRAEASIADTASHIRGTEDKIFAWHFMSVLGEFAVASHDSDKALRNRAYDAHLLVTEFPEWVRAIEAGRVDLRHANAMLRHARVLQESHFAEYGATVLDYAATHSPGETTRFAERTASTVAAEQFEAAHERARSERYVSIRHDGLGMAVLNAYLPSEIAAPIEQLLDKRARELRELDKTAAQEHRAASRAARAARATRPETPPEPVPELVPDGRTFAQIRADVFAETLLCASPGESRVKAIVSITVPALGLLHGRTDGTEPALLEGTLPMSFAQARQFAGEATSFRRVLTDPVTGHTTSVDDYLPDRSLRQFLQIRDRTCRFPGCLRPAALSEIDHTTPFREQGATSAQNLAHLCKGHHVQKHEKPWSVTNLGNGVLQWRTPLGQIVTTSPERLGPRFVPTGSEGNEHPSSRGDPDHADPNGADPDRAVSARADPDHADPDHADPDHADPDHADDENSATGPPVDPSVDDDPPPF